MATHRFFYLKWAKELYVQVKLVFFTIGVAPGTLSLSCPQKLFLGYQDQAVLKVSENISVITNLLIDLILILLLTPSVACELSGCCLLDKRTERLSL